MPVIGYLCSLHPTYALSSIATTSKEARFDLSAPRLSSAHYRLERRQSGTPRLPSMWTIDVDHRCRPSMSTVDVDHRCGPSMLTIDVDHRCGPSMLTIDVDHRCGPSMWTIDVDHRCGPSMWSIDVDHRCGPSMLTIDVNNRCGPSMWTTDVDHRCGPSMLTIDVDHRCRPSWRIWETLSDYLWYLLLCCLLLCCSCSIFGLNFSSIRVHISFIQFNSCTQLNSCLHSKCHALSLS